MIPKTIHYCWFGGNPLPELAIKCIESWKKYCPDYKIIEWNESNFDINCCDYVREAYEAKKWAFVSDVARLYALVNYGGIYMDTDVEVIKVLDDLLEFKAVAGFEADDRIQTGVLACEQMHPFFAEFLQDYDTISFINDNGDYDATTNVFRITNHCIQNGLKLNGELQTINDVTFLQREYLCPLNNSTGELKITKNTYVIHWFTGSWLDEMERKSIQRSRKICKFVGSRLGPIINSIIYNLEKGGIKQLSYKFFHKFKER